MSQGLAIGRELLHSRYIYITHPNYVYIVHSSTCYKWYEKVDPATCVTPHRFYIRIATGVVRAAARRRELRLFNLGLFQ